MNLPDLVKIDKYGSNIYINKNDIIFISQDGNNVAIYYKKWYQGHISTESSGTTTNYFREECSYIYNKTIDQFFYELYKEMRDKMFSNKMDEVLK